MSTNEGERSRGEIAVPSAESEAGKRTPRAFISYSHDSDEHGAWVLQLAETLVRAGVDVTLDQWDLGPGDDLVRFMHRSVADADRVLMVCTAAYVRKADEGEGGVGYEAMVVDGELVRNQGSNKFIPVVRQDGAEPVIPKSVSTRLYVNLSDAQKEDREFEKLVREIHQTPKAHKPELGKNPFPPCAAVQLAEASVAAIKMGEAENAYLTGCEIARRGDLKAWRELVREVKEPLSGRLNEWRKSYDGAQSMQIQALPGMILEAATIYSPLMAVALAGVESGQERFAKQTALLDEFLQPRHWNSAGLAVVGSIPEALVFTFQAVHGATCVEVGELGLAIRLSRARIARAHHFEAVVLHTDYRFVGVPESFGERSNEAWKYLTAMPEKWPWLNRIFGSQEAYQSALCAYYMALSVQELAWRIADAKGDFTANDNFYLDVPAAWLGVNHDIQRKAYSRLVEAEEQTREVWRSLGVSDGRMAAVWPVWVEKTKRWITGGGHYPSYHKPVHETLFEDLRPTS